MAGKGVSKRTGRIANRGFTLVELLVVMTIIALLMSILMPALRRVKMQAEELKCKANLRQVGPIVYMYIQDEDSNMPKIVEFNSIRRLIHNAAMRVVGATGAGENGVDTLLFFAQTPLVEVIFVSYVLIIINCRPTAKKEMRIIRIGDFGFTRLCYNRIC